MKLNDIAIISANSLTERKFRFALNLIGILIGCAAVTGLISLTQGMNAEISGELESAESVASLCSRIVMAL